MRYLYDSMRHSTVEWYLFIKTEVVSFSKSQIKIINLFEVYFTLRLYSCQNSSLTRFLPMADSKQEVLNMILPTYYICNQSQYSLCGDDYSDKSTLTDIKIGQSFVRLSRKKCFDDFFRGAQNLEDASTTSLLVKCRYF